MTLRLKVVQNRRLFGAGGAHQGLAVDGPVEIGHYTAPIAHRTCNGNRNTVDIVDTLFFHIGAQNGFQARVACVFVAVDGVSAQSAGRGERDARVGSADVSDKKSAGGGRLGHGPGSDMSGDAHVLLGCFGAGRQGVSGSHAGRGRQMGSG